MKNLILFLLIIFTFDSFALPRYAVRLKDKCIDCHVNPTGGIIRNESGFYFGKNIISMISPREKDFLLSPRLTDNITIGFDYRTQYLYSQSKKRSDFQDMSGAIYTNVKVSEKIDVVARYDFRTFIWEGYGVAKILPNESYIKVGSYQPYFGIRIDDHTAYSRGGDVGLLFATGQKQGLIYNPYYVETGVEIGVNITNNIFATASIGKPNSQSVLRSDPTITTRLEYNTKLGKIGLLLGGSYAKLTQQRAIQMYAGFMGIGFGRFSFLGEYDIAEDYIAEGIKSSAIMAEVSYQVLVGLEALVRYDSWKANNDDDNSISRLIAGFEFYPYSFVEISPQYRFQFEDPKIENDAFVIQFHFWY